MLVESEGNAAIPYLDAQAAADPFEERPLIWKAHLLLQDGKLDEAEKAIRSAIAIDPSDGEMGDGDRLRAYTVLADILEKKGNSEDAKIYRNAVAAIRLAEKADDLNAAGLRTRAIAKYEEALGLFADAYCIQSRLAVQLADMGRMTEAEEHYRRAYELMPDSFGRMESHCFGCERAFKGPLAESLAEKTFTKLVEKSPDKPQLHYLLGYLRKEQGREKEALKHFMKAVELDPEYLNAWKMILDISNKLLLPGKERDDAAFALLRLDSARRHAHPDFDQIVDLKTLWTLANRVETTEKSQKSPAILPLAASDVALKQLSESERLILASDSDAPLTPGEALGEQDVIEMITLLMNRIAYFNE
jgi:tetratricopeptide (TPR) repeat protein